MEKSIKGTRTEQNLLKAFAGESQAKNRYEFAAKVAKDEGYEQIAAIFLETALQEQSHAKQFFRFLEGGMLEITASYPAGKTKATKENLEAAADDEAGKRILDGHSVPGSPRADTPAQGSAGDARG